ncbi:MAG: hypothetical protein ABIQ22_14580, partial [Arthrobacter oryzae]
CGLFWIMDTPGGGRKLPGMTGPEIFRTATAGGHGSPGAEPLLCRTGYAVTALPEWPSPRANPRSHR